MSGEGEAKAYYNHPISVDEMWSLTNREEKNWGIEGYEIHKTYFDHAQQKRTNARNTMNEKVWARRGHYDKIPPKLDKDGKPIILKRPNYLDEVIRIANSFFDKVRSDKLTEDLKDKSLKPYSRKRKEDVKRAPRELFTETMIKAMKKNNEPQKDKDLTAILEKIKEHEKKKQVLPMELTKQKYAGDKGRRGTSCCERVNVTSEAIFVGEQIPFFNTAPPKEGAEEKYEDFPGGLLKDQCVSGNAKERKYKKNKVLFFPRKFFISAWGKAPGWVYPKKSVKSDKCNYEQVESVLKEKRDKVVEKLKNIKARLDVDVPQSWYEVNYHNRLWIKFLVPAKKAEWYAEWRKNNPQKAPGPQQYWKRYPVKYVAGKSKPVPPKPIEQEEGKPKVYILEDKYSGNKYYKPMKSHIY